MADPLIAIIGSVHPDRADDLRLRNAIAGERAAEDIGHALARQRCRIVAYSDKGWSVESSVIKGYIEECKKNSSPKYEGSRIEVHYSTSDEAPHFSEQDKNSQLFS